MGYLTVEEVAEMWRVSVATVRRWCGEGTIPAERHGRQWLMEEDTLPASAPNQRRRRSLSADTAGQYDLTTALKFVRATDLRELWVPDILHSADLLANPALLSRVEERLNRNLFDPCTQIPIPKTTFFTRSAVHLTLEDRIAFQALVGSFADRVEQQTPAGVFSARLAKGRSGTFFNKKGAEAWLDWRKAVRRELFAGKPWMVKTDLTAFFDTIPHDLLVPEVQALNPPGKAVGTLRAMLRQWTIVPGQGIPQGPNASRLLGNLFLIPVDHSMVAAGFTYLRYLDDVRILAATKAEAIRAIRLFEAECRNRGLLVSSAKTELLGPEESVGESGGNRALDGIEYHLETGDTSSARRELRKLLRKALAREGNIEVRNAKFGLVRLGRLRESSVLKDVVQHLEDLAPVAPQAMRYLGPFLARPQVIHGLTEYLEDDDRASSPYMLAWTLAVMLDASAPARPWIDAARRTCRDRNQPGYLRVIAANLSALGREPSELAWHRDSVAREHDPALVRGNLVALARVGSLDKATCSIAIAKAPELAPTIEFLRGRSDLPSLVNLSRANPIS